MSEIAVEVDGAKITLETGRVARQADGAVVLRHGGSFLLAVVVSAAAPRPGDEFFPLTVEYRERMSAGGRIPGSYFRREGRITEREILTSRLIDRTLRPLFPEGFRCETQVTVTVFSADKTSDLEGLALLAAAAAVHVSDVPFDGPVAGTRVARTDGRLRLLPTPAERNAADLDFVVSASRSGLVMIEGEGRCVTEADVLAAWDAAVAGLRPVLDALDALREAAGARPRRAFVAPARDPDLAEAVRAQVEARLEAALDEPDKATRAAAVRAARQVAVEALGGPDGARAREVASLFSDLHYDAARRRTVAGRRIGGRTFTDIRAITAEVGLLAASHGSALFTRGDTQALVSATLGHQREAQDIETLFGSEQDRFLLHYNFPPYSVGETGPSRGPGRREIGHGNLARRALAGVLPPNDRFPYTVRVVSDITESNGSSSMATVCGGCLALMDAGVPLAAPVAGIAMGLVREGDQVAILSDILGDEDHLGDMDFKVAGTADAVTAVQLDNKLGSLPREVLVRALAQAADGRRHILAAMAGTLAAAREHVAEAAPQFARLQISPSRIGALIGSGGRTIQELQSRTRSQIEVKDDGTVTVYGRDAEGAREAVRQVKRLTMELTRNGLYLAQVVSIKEFGAFVRIGDHEGLVHVSELANERVDKVSDVVREGEEVLVRVLGTDERGRLRISRKAALDASPLEALNA